MQNKLHEAQSLPRQHAGYYETLKNPQKHWGSVHHTAFYSTVVENDCQEELYKMTAKNRTKSAKKTKVLMATPGLSPLPFLISACRAVPEMQN